MIEAKNSTVIATHLQLPSDSQPPDSTPPQQQSPRPADSGNGDPARDSDACSLSEFLECPKDSPGHTLDAPKAPHEPSHATGPSEKDATAAGPSGKDAAAADPSNDDGSGSLETAGDTDPTKVAMLITLKQIYGIFCWLQEKANNQLWREAPLEACRRATHECPYLAAVDPQMIRLQLDEINRQRREIINKYNGICNVPSSLRVVPNGPLVVLADFVLGGKCTQQQQSCTQQQHHHQQQPCTQQQQQQQHKPDAAAATGSGAGGAVRHGRVGAATRKISRRLALPRDHPIMQRAMRLTPQEIEQMKQEMVVRREIARRDALLLADWIALKRRELEIKEMKLRAHAREPHESMRELLDFERFLSKELQND